MKMQRDTLLTWLLVIFLSPILRSSHITQAQQFLYNYCQNGSSYPSFGSFHNNLNRLLLQRLYIQGGISGFYNTTVGDPPDEAYGLFLCRGDVSPDMCQRCIDNASTRITDLCPGGKNASIWYDECPVRYSDRNFFTVMEENPFFYMYNYQNATDQEKFNETLSKTFTKLIEDVVSDPSKKMYGTANTSLLSSFSTLYELVQCFPNLSKDDCTRCFGSALAYMPTFSIGARMFLPSCNIRYERYRFYDPSGGLVPVPGPSNETNRAPSSGTNQNGASDKGSKTKKRIWIIVAIAAGSACLMVSLSGYIIFVIRRRSSRKDQTETSQEVQLLNLRREDREQLPKEFFREERPTDSLEFPSMQLQIIYAATNNFSNENKLGEGGFGPVYKVIDPINALVLPLNKNGLLSSQGILEDGKEIAVKRLSGASGQGLLELQTEVTLIARLQHRNLVKLLGCCLENGEKLLIYEYMPNKSLDIHLFGSSFGGTGAFLDWTTRLSIINGIARGLLYLHEDSRLRIIHRDLKASNILLDHDMNPKISDFGMARIVAGNESGDTTNRVVGTYGYMAPEYAMEGLFSVKSDVFSFGVLLLELLSGKRNNGFHLHKHGKSLLTYAWSLWGEGRGAELIDPLMGGSLDMAQALKCIHIGLLCVQEEPANRPIMSLVLLMLGGDTISLPRPTQPAFSVSRQARTADGHGSHDRVCSNNVLTVSELSPR